LPIFEAETRVLSALGAVSEKEISVSKKRNRFLKTQS
jgi:hypothetical protein